MHDLDAGDLVRAHGTDYDMMVIGRADEEGDDETEPSVFCVWERTHYLHEKVFAICDLMLIRKERRRIPRNGCLLFPVS